MKKGKIFLITISLVLVAALIIYGSINHPIDYNTQVKPILNKNCITCHGGVKRLSNFSLLFRSEALAKNKSGKPAIIPGDPDHSEMIRRLTLKDPEERMPYKHDPLSASEIDILRKWIKQGAKWGDHWAYVAVQPVEVPKPKGHLFGLIPASKLDWAKNDIDYFVDEKLKEEKLQHAPQAADAELLRRVSLDLTGLPPSPELARQYLSAPGDQAYEKLVDALLASPRYGEKWTSMWLDLARYADTRGYEKDGDRNIWKYRDWVIRAFNQDKPYNVFLTEQLAGDLLPNHTDAQMIATGFHRNTMTNDEGGTDNEEFRTAAVLDRVNTTWEGFMGTTFGCVQCHSHPYDPFKHEEYYKFMAFFNNSRDEDTFGDYPLLRQFSEEDSLKVEKVYDWLKQHESASAAADERRFMKTWQMSVNSIRADQMVNSALADTKFLTFRENGSARLPQVNLDQKSRLVYRYNAGIADGVWTIHLDSLRGAVLKTVAVAKSKKSDWEITYVDLPEARGTHDLFMTYSNPRLKGSVNDGLQFDWFHFTQRFPETGTKENEEIEKMYWNIVNEDVPGTPVMMENPETMHRNTYVFERGNWLVKGEEVTADVPHSLNPLPPNAPHNRLGLAMWMTDKKNPLTSRTIVNRLWEQLFGTGLVETLEDMGTQGALPTHKDLLDYLAYQFMNDYGWSLKKMLKEMVMSATYRQDSKVTNEMLARDPANKWLERGARVRLSAEQVRDQALAVSGLLSDKMYGPSVMPWQPAGIWHSPYNSATWTKSKGEDQYRRAVYTFLKRTAPYPSMITFDGVSREVCTARRILSNTPLQALVTLDDSVYLEASRYLAYRMMDEATDKKNPAEIISRGYQIAMFKPIAPAKEQALKNLYDTAYRQYLNDREKTRDVAGLDDKHDNPETAAWVVVANALLNLDEVITKN